VRLPPTSNIGQRLTLALFLLVCAGATLALDGWLAVTDWRQLRALQFPTARGTVLSSRVIEERHEETGVRHDVRVEYEYTVAGERHIGHRFRYGSLNLGEGPARAIVQSLPPGAAVDVYYEPRQPAVALLRPGLDGADLFLALALLPLNLVTAGLARGLVQSFRVRETNPCERLKRRQEGLDPWSAAGLAALFASLAAVFAVAFSLGVNPPLWVMCVVWSMVWGVAGLAFYARMIVLAVERTGPTHRSDVAAVR
jgi:hypothetical protein